MTTTTAQLITNVRPLGAAPVDLLIDGGGAMPRARVL